MQNAELQNAKKRNDDRSHMVNTSRQKLGSSKSIHNALLKSPLVDVQNGLEHRVSLDQCNPTQG